MLKTKGLPKTAIAGKLIHAAETPHFTIHIRENKYYRWMHFGNGNIQSAMCLTDPDTLPFPYMHTILGWQLFHPNPKSILMLGLGGGTLVRYFHNHFPDTQLTVVELSQPVIDIAKNYFYLPTNWQNLTIINDDAEDHITQTNNHYDIIIIDLYLANKLPNFLDTQTFYQQCQQRLTTNGILAFNFLVNSPEIYYATIKKIRDAFDNQTLTVDILDQTVIVFAFNQKLSSQYITQLASENKIKNPTYDTQAGLITTAIEYA